MFDTIRLKIQNRSLKIIVWDLDGTLYKGEGVGKAIKKYFLNYLVQTLRIPRQEALQQLDTITHNTGRWSLTMSRLCKKPEACFIRQIEKNVHKHKYIKPDAPLVQMIKSLKQYRHVIVTNSTTYNARRVLLALGFSMHNRRIEPFERIFAFDRNGYLKPDFRAYQQVLIYTGEAPYRHLAVGDTISTDILPAKTLDMKTALLGSHHAGANFSFSSVKPLCKALASFL